MFLNHVVKYADELRKSSSASSSSTSPLSRSPSCSPAPVHTRSFSESEESNSVFSADFDSPLSSRGSSSSFSIALPSKEAIQRSQKMMLEEDWNRKLLEFQNMQKNEKADLDNIHMDIILVLLLFIAIAVLAGVAVSVALS